MYCAISKLRVFLFLFLGSFFSNQVLALTFTPTEAEWLTWGEMCQARYVVSGAGMNSEFYSRISRDKVKLWESKLGPKAWYGLHHYCAGVIIDNKRGNPKGALPEYKFAFVRTPATDPFYSVIGAKIAFAYYKLNNKEKAKKYALQIISANARAPDGYLIKGIIEHNNKEYKKAVQTLETGNSNTQGRSAELNYHLALNYYALGNFDATKQYAQVAYDLGYPLPWLREQLKKEGHW